MCTDADMVFQDNFLQSALSILAEDPDAFVVCRCHDLPESLAETLWDVSQMPMLAENGVVRNFGGTGACQIARRDFFVRARGYDEKFTFWGSEDRDMLARAERGGHIVCV